jgi:predicted AAA+ superfamily ATPase
VGVSSGSPIIRLETSFGGGKTHDEIALWHIAKQGRHIEGLERFADLALIPDRPIQVAAIACQDLDPINGVYHPESGITTYTLWGEIAYQIGNVEGYSLLRGSDEKRVSPGTVVLERLTKGQPTLIVLDEIARHLRAAKATTVGNSDLAGQVVAFLFSLMDLAASSNNLVFVYTLAASTDTFGEETAEIREAMQSSARQERVLYQFFKDQLQIVRPEWSANQQWRQSLLGASLLTWRASTTATHRDPSAVATAVPT